MTRDANKEERQETRATNEEGFQKMRDTNEEGLQSTRASCEQQVGEREFFVDSLLVRIHFTIEMIWWTGFAPWELEFPFPGSLRSTFLNYDGD